MSLLFTYINVYSSNVFTRVAIEIDIVEVINVRLSGLTTGLNRKAMRMHTLHSRACTEWSCG